SGAKPCSGGSKSRRGCSRRVLLRRGSSGQTTAMALDGEGRDVGVVPAFDGVDEALEGGVGVVHPFGVAGVPEPVDLLGAGIGVVQLFGLDGRVEEVALAVGDE